MSADPATIAGLDRHDLYEVCVQSPADTVPLLRAIHGGEARVLGEDFAGTAALARAWVGSADDTRALAVDHDAETLAEARRRATAASVPSDRLTLVEGDVVAATTPPEADAHRADIVYTGNFSIGELPTRVELLRYVQHVRQRLRPGGIFAADLYGGESAFMIGVAERHEPGPDGGTIVYSWEQREADPLTGRVVNAVHFELLDQDEESQGSISDAFVYHWRLWSVPELREVLIEAGFATTEVHTRLPEAIDDEDVAYVRAIDDPDDLEDSFDVLVVGRV